VTGLIGLYALYSFSFLVTDPSSPYYDGADNPDNLYTVGTSSSKDKLSLDTCTGMALEHDLPPLSSSVSPREHATKSVLIVVTRAWQSHGDLSFIFSRPIIQHAVALASAAHLGYKVTVLYAAPERSIKDDFWKIESALADMGIDLRMLCIWPGKFTTSPPAYKPMRTNVDMMLWLSQHQYDYSSVVFDLFKNVMYYTLQRRHVGLDFNNLHFAAHAVSFQKRSLAHKREFLSTQNQVYERFFEQHTVRMVDYVVTLSEEVGRELSEEYEGVRIKNVQMDPVSSYASEPLIPWAPPAAGVPARLVFYIVGTSFVSQSDIAIMCDAFRRIHAKAQSEELDIPGFSVVYSGLNSKKFRETCLATDADKKSGMFKIKMASYSNAMRMAAENRDRAVLVVPPSRVQDYQLVIDAAAKQIGLVYPDDYASLFFGSAASQPGAYPSTLGGFETRLIDVLTEQVTIGQLRQLPRSCGTETLCQGNVLNAFLEIDTDKLNKRTRMRVQEWLTRDELVSVVIPNYGRTEYLVATVESIQRSSWSNIEVIVVDDGSSEPEDIARLEKMRQDFAPRGWRIIQTNHVGAAAARNTGAKAARGEFVMLFDSDDFIRPNTIELMLKIMLGAHADVVVGFIHGFGNPADEPNQVPISDHAARPYWLSLGAGTGPAFFQNTAGGANALFRKSVYLEVGGETEIDKMAHLDYEFFVRLGLHGARFQLFPDVGYDYRRNAVGSIFAKNTDIYRNDMHSLKPFLEAVPESLQPILEMAFANNRG
jgi:GT2 family glycosyltransferase